MQFWATSDGRVGRNDKNKTESAGRKWVRFQGWLLLEVIGKMPIGGGGEKEKDIKKRGRKFQRVENLLRDQRVQKYKNKTHDRVWLKDPRWSPQSGEGAGQRSAWHLPRGVEQTGNKLRSKYNQTAATSARFFFRPQSDPEKIPSSARVRMSFSISTGIKRARRGLTRVNRWRRDVTFPRYVSHLCIRGDM